MGTKICFRCKVEQPLTNFYASTARGSQRECKPCTRERRSRWWKSDSGKRSSANTKLKQRFGIDQTEYDVMLEAQGGKCAICEATSSCLGHKLAVDHDHKTGKIRALLCKACNTGIGNLRDNPVLCRVAAQYLEKYAA